MEVLVIGVYQMPTLVLIAKDTTILEMDAEISNAINVSGSLKRPNVIPSHGP